MTFVDPRVILEIKYVCVYVAELTTHSAVKDL
jgi:hypothetical protein